MIIAVDGPAASGKGTLARKLAERFELPYLDTGSIYRALGAKCLEKKISCDDVKRICEVAENLSEKDFKAKNLNTEKVGSMASKVAVIPEVRAILLDFQRKTAYNDGKGAVLDGRDIGTVVCPDADYKFYVVSSVEKRARCRHADLIALGDKTITYEEVLQQLQERDERDSKRKNAPLKKAKDAIEIDSTMIGAEAVFEFALSVITDKMKKAKVS